MNALTQDVKYALRMLVKSPGFAAVAIATLALGIGSNTAIFSIVRGVLLRGLPYRDPHRLVVVWEDLLREGNHRFSVAAPNFEDLRARSRSFEGLAAQLGAPYNLNAAGEPPESVLAARVTGNFFSLLGVRPALGRVLVAADERKGETKRVAVLSHALWKRRFAGDPGIVGRKIRLSDVLYEVVGVLGPNFEFPAQLKAPEQMAQIWTPMDLPAAWNARGVAVYQVIGRLGSASSLGSADADVAGVARALAKEYPATNENVGMHVVTLEQQIVGDVRSALLLLSGAVGFVLLVVCANIAHFLLARAGARRRETAIRVALGASRGRIVSALLAEALLLAVAGGTLAGILVLATESALLTLAPPSVPRLDLVRIDGAVLAFASLVSLLAGLVSGLLPAWRAAGTAPESVLRGEGLAGGLSASRLRAALVVSQIAAALVLFSGALVLLKTFEHLRRFDLGFAPDHVVTARLGLPRARYATPQRQVAFFHELFRRVEAHPEISAAGGTTRFPLDPAYGVGEITFEGRAASPGDAPVVGVRVLGGNYFAAMGIPIHSGRSFDDRDREDSTPTVLVNRTMAARFWPGADPVGQRIAIGQPANAWLTVVGVVGDVSHDGIDAAPISEAYLPLAQAPGGGLNLVVRPAAGASGAAAILKRELSALDPEVPLSDLRPMDDRVFEALAQPRFLLESFGAFGLLTLLLSALGLVALVAHDVERRRREIGIRLALGARGQDVVRLILARAAALVGLGAMIGLAVPLSLTRRFAPVLHGTRTDDPEALIVATALLTAVALLSAAIPARRATRIDPIQALRAE